MATVPPAPTPWYASAIFETQITGNSDPTGDGGDPPILGSQIAYGPNASSPTHPDNVSTTLLGADGAGTITGLASKVTYYFWARFRNSIGYSGWSARTSYRTKGVPGTPGAPFTDTGSKTQTSIGIRFNTSSDDGGDPITTHAVGYSHNPFDTVPATILTQAQSIEVFDFTGLAAGETYYFWARSTNLHGNSDWSAKSTINLLAGAWVRDDPQWKRAVPYVRDGGVWKLARPWVRNVGFWNETVD